ncbi:hypothetical protein ACIRBY_32170 [Streptomyces sp. NPDC096136]|uniref:hypothetical protein n=1 Tax=Streptomyces sp. NPDC096136 TaxID=3366076 RepID=UPI00381380A6
MSSRTDRSEPCPGYTHVHVTLTQDPPPLGHTGREHADGDVSFTFSIPHGPPTVPLLPPEDRAPTRFADELLGCAADIPRETLDRLLASHDAHAARLGRAVRAVQTALGTERGAPAPASFGVTALDPVTHDPAW